MINSISILGSTGSIGRQAIDAALDLGIPVTALAARSDIRLLEEQARLLKPCFAAVYDEDKAADLRVSLADTSVRVVSGEGGLVEAAAESGADAVLNAVSGSVGLMPTLAAIEKGLRICLANKETLVCAGEIVMRKAKAHGARIIPVDSEHSAIFQCLQGRGEGEPSKILLTASGGPFLGLSRDETRDVTPERAVRHPRWSMGAKISVDSATMMNKGLEIIEAMHLFSVRAEDIEVLIHPQSIIHSMVRLTDGSVIAQCAPPDMALPIRYSMTWPDRRGYEGKGLDFAELAVLSFERPDLQKMPCLSLAIDAAKRGGNLPCAMNAANEEAVALFLQGVMGYNDIYDRVAGVMARIDFTERPSLDDILETDRLARKLI